MSSGRIGRTDLKGCAGNVPVHQEKAGKESRYYAEVISDGKVYADSLDREYFLTAETKGILQNICFQTTRM